MLAPGLPNGSIRLASETDSDEQGVRQILAEGHNTEKDDRTGKRRRRNQSRSEKQVCDDSGNTSRATRSRRVKEDRQPTITKVTAGTQAISSSNDDSRLRAEEQEREKDKTIGDGDGRIHPWNFDRDARTNENCQRKQQGKTKVQFRIVERSCGITKDQRACRDYRPHVRLEKPLSTCVHVSKIPARKKAGR